MPYRAVLMTIVAVAIALLAVEMWLRAVEPWVNASQAATQEAAQKGSPEFSTSATDPATLPATSDAELRAAVKVTLGVSFLVIGTLLTVALFFATLREWMRYRGYGASRRGKRTPYVDAWKIAAERMKVDGEATEGGKADEFGLDDEPPLGPA